jgi:hypothetical protein
MVIDHIENILTDTAKNNALPDIWESLNLVKLTFEINEHQPQRFSFSL